MGKRILESLQMITIMLVNRIAGGYILLLIFLSCSSRNYDNRQVVSFVNSERWKADTFGCMSYRYKMTNEIIGKKDSLSSLKESEILYLFGEPNLKRIMEDKVIFFYINEPNLYCDGKVDASYILKTEVSTINFIFNTKGQLYNVESKLP